MIEKATGRSSTGLPRDKGEDGQKCPTIIHSEMDIAWGNLELHRGKSRVEDPVNH